MSDDILNNRISAMKKLVKDKPIYKYGGYTSFGSQQYSFAGNGWSTPSTASSTSYTGKPPGFDSVLKFFKRKIGELSTVDQIDRLGHLVDRSVSLDDDTKIALFYELDDIAEMLTYDGHSYFANKIWEITNLSEAGNLRRFINRSKNITEEEKSHLLFELDNIAECLME